MKQKKIKILIGILLALLAFSSSIALLMYSKKSKVDEYIKSQAQAYIVTKTINKGQKIDANDIKLSTFLKEHIPSKLVKEEIIGRYAKVDIYMNEPIRSHKISNLPIVSSITKSPKKKSQQKQEIVEEDSTYYDTITLPLNIFKNIDPSLKKNDLIDIVSVKSKKTSINGLEFSTKYVALRVKIYSFVYNSNFVKSIYITKDEKTNTAILANSIVLEISPNDVKKFLPIYYKTQDLNSKRVYTSKDNRGHLWIIKCSQTIDEKIQTQKKKLLVDYKRKYIPKQRKNRVEISYEN